MNRDTAAAFLEENFITATRVAEILGCTRANVSDLVRRGKLSPIAELGSMKLFWLGDVLARRDAEPKPGRPFSSPDKKPAE